MMSRPRKSLGEDICKLKFCRDLRKTNDITLIFITNKMAVNFDMFGTFMEDGIFSDSDSPSIVGMQWSRRGLSEPKLRKKAP